MSDLPPALKKLKYDKRMIHWNLRQKLLTQREYQKHLESLEDLSHLKADEVPEDPDQDPDSSKTGEQAHSEE